MNQWVDPTIGRPPRPRAHTHQSAKALGYPSYHTPQRRTYPSRRPPRPSRSRAALPPRAGPALRWSPPFYSCVSVCCVVVWRGLIGGCGGERRATGLGSIQARGPLELLRLLLPSPTSKRSRARARSSSAPRPLLPSSLIRACLVHAYATQVDTHLSDTQHTHTRQPASTQTDQQPPWRALFPSTWPRARRS